MPLIIPVAKNYQNPVNSLPAIFGQTEPPEGPRLVPIEIDWGTMASPEGAVSINLYGGGAQTLSQIVAISVDNSGCGADIQFVFPDTSQTYTVAAYEPIATFPVFTNQTQFFVVSPNAEASDTTRFAILNTMPPAVSLPLSVEQQSASVGDLTVATGTTDLVAAGINGTLEGIFINFTFGSGAASAVWELVDGETTPKVIAAGNVSNADNSPVSIAPITVRFINGLKLVMTLTGAAGNQMAINLYYRTP